MESSMCIFDNPPSMFAILSLFLNCVIYFYRLCCVGKRRKFPPLSIMSTICIIVYVVLMASVSAIMYKEDYCVEVVVITAFLSLNWLIVILTLLFGKVAFENIILYQVMVSCLELVSILWNVVSILRLNSLSFTPWYYFLVLLSSFIWGFGCNFLWLNSLYSLRKTGYHNMLDPDDEDDNVQNAEQNFRSHGEIAIVRSVLFFWFTRVLEVGSAEDMTIDDLVPLPTSMTSREVRKSFQPDMDGEGHVVSEPKTAGYYLFQSVFGAATYECGSWCRWKSNSQDSSTSNHDTRNSSVDSVHSATSIASDPSALPPSPVYTSMHLPPLRHARALLYSILVEGERGRTFALLGVIKMLALCASFAGPLLLGQMVKLVEKSPGRKDIPMGLLLACTLGASFVFLAALNTQFTIRASVMQVKIRGALSLGLFSRAMQLPLRELYSRNLTDAQIANMMQVDVQRAGDIISSLHDLWALPCQIVLAFALLYLQVNVAFFSGIFIIGVMIPINRWIAVRIGRATEQLMQHKDARVKLVTECIRGIRSVKMCGLEDTMCALSMTHREQEVKYLSRRKYLDAWCVFLWASMPLLVPYVTFVTTVSVLDRTLSASEVFTTIALLNMLIYPMNAYPWIINGLVEASVSIRRLALLVVVTEQISDAQFDESNGHHHPGGGRLLLDLGYVCTQAYDVDSIERSMKLGPRGVYSPPVILNPSQSSSSVPVVKSPLIGDASFIVANDLTMSWNEEELRRLDRRIMSKADSLAMVRDIYAKRVLKDTSFAVGPVTLRGVRGGMVIGVCGKVGSGKSTFLLGLLKECFTYSPSRMHTAGVSLDSGAVYIRTTVSYCSQSPAMHAGSVRSNVCFESPFLEARYLEVMRGCGLDVDFNITRRSEAQRFSSGQATPIDKNSDETDIGQGGSRLSGGQRLRVGIARALYANTSTVLLDDPFSALDRKTSGLIMEYILDISLREKRCVVIVTNDVHILAKGVELILVLSGGQVVDRGGFADLCASSATFRSLKEEVAASNADEEDELDIGKSSIGESAAEEHKGGDVLRSHSISSLKDSFAGREGKETVEAEEEADEHMERGEISASVITTYFKAIGFGVVILILFSTFCMQVSANGMSIWLAYWTDNIDNISNKWFLIISTIIIGCNVLFALVRSFSFAWGGLIAAKKEYRLLTHSTFSTYLSFFESNSLGRIINRFGKDADIVDDQLPFMLNRVLAQIFTLLGAIIVISISSVLVIVVIAVVAIVYYRLQKFYRKSSRDLRRLEAIYKSPVGNILMDCLANAPSIRAQNLRVNFEDHIAEAIDNSQRVSLTSAVAGQWLTIRLQCLGILVTFSLAVVAVFNAVYEVAPISASMLGLSLSYAFALVGYLNGLVNSVIESEQEMISVERMDEYIKLPSEYTSYDIDHVDEGEDSGSSTISISSIASSPTDQPNKYADQARPDANWPMNGSISLSHVSFSYDMEKKFKLSANPEESGALSRAKRMMMSTLASGMRSLGSGYSHLDDVHGNSDDDEDLGEGCQHYALKDMSIVIAAGSRVAVVGRTGSGKSSFLRLLLNLNKSFEGRVSMGGLDIRDISKRTLRKHCGVISQEPFLFTGTIRSNIDPKGEHSDEAITAAICKCGIIDTFSDSSDIGELMRAVNRSTQSSNSLGTISDESSTMLLECQIIDGASSLSQGQKQLLCVARVLLQKPKFVFLDEASSSLDPASETLMYKALATNLPDDTTVLAISHRYDREGIRALCNQVLELDHGKLTKFEDIYFL